MRNEAMAALEPLVGEWRLTLTGAWFLDSPDVRVEGTATIEWLGDGFLPLRSVFDGKPDWEWVIGRSDARGEYAVLYFDPRGVDRVFRMSFGDGSWTMEREDPDFHQRLIATVEPDRIQSHFDASEDGGLTWRKDFDLIWERASG
jgi:hypothetical protein